MSAHTRASRYIGHGITVIDFPAEVLVNAKYKFNENNTNNVEIIDYASTERLPDDEASIAMTWNGTEKRFVGTCTVTDASGRTSHISSARHKPTQSFWVPDPNDPTKRRAGVSCGWSKPNETADFVSDYTLLTKDYVCHPSAVVEGAPITSYAANTDYRDSLQRNSAAVDYVPYS